MVRMGPRPLATAALVAALFASACSSDETAREQPPSPALRLVEVAALEQPLALATRPHDPSLYVAQKTGKVVAIRGHQVTSVLDLSKQISLGGEQGLLGLTFSPDGRFLYVDYTGLRGNTRVKAFGFRDGRTLRSSARQILFVHQPFANHNGGDIVFGPDGMLYVGLGDGGSGGDPMDNGQSLDTLLGKILRIDPTPDGPAPYRIPPDNPFVGVPAARPELWAYGLRNPWRFSFDRTTGDLWIGDVGQSSWEEIDRRPGDRGGVNYGWSRMEGDHQYGSVPPPPGAVGPVYEYSHDAGCVVTGGYVYRGRLIPTLRGEYLFADFCAGQIMALRLAEDGTATAHALGPTVPSVSSFGEGAAGELYVLSLDGGLYRLAPAG